MELWRALPLTSLFIESSLFDLYPKIKQNIRRDWGHRSSSRYKRNPYFGPWSKSPVATICIYIDYNDNHHDITHLRLSKSHLIIPNSHTNQLIFHWLFNACDHGTMKWPRHCTFTCCNLRVVLTTTNKIEGTKSDAM